ncbi:MAG: PAS domain S-box protein [Massilia sp.]|nr:PAS domain S-box protein [Massilia sp.]
MLDTLPEDRFDRITRLAAHFFDVPIALVSLVDERRQWFKSRYGLSVGETPRSDSFCAHAVEERGLLVVEDAQLDPRFVANPLVVGGPLIRFYAGQPVFSHDGFALGTLCIIDTVPRKFSDADLTCLRDFALLIEEEFSKVAIARTVVSTSAVLINTEAKFQATFEQAAVGIAHVGLDGTLMKVNRKFYEIVGREAGELEQLTFQQITHPADLDLDLRLFNEMLAGARLSYAIEKRYIHKNGQHVWVNLTVSMHRNAQGAPDYFISVIEDIQDKKQAQFALQRSNEELESRVLARTVELERTVQELGYEVSRRTQVEAELRMSEIHTRTILEASHHAFVGIDDKGDIINWNRAAEQTFGWTAEEALGKNLTATIIPAAHHKAHQQGMDEFLKTGQGMAINRRLEWPAKTKSGRQIPVEMTISPYKVNDAVYFGAFLHDISDRIAAAAKLEQKQNLLDAVLDSVDVGVVACDAEGRITLFNRAAALFHGVQSTPVPAHDWAKAFDLYGADGITPLSRLQIPLYRALMGEMVENAEMTIVPKGRVARFVFASGKRLIGSNGENLGAVVAMKDVTELKNLETQRALNESRLRAITENLPALIGHVDKDLKFLFLNNHALRFYGKTNADLIGQGIGKIYSDDEYAVIAPYVASARAGHRASFESHVSIAGERRYFSAVYVPEVVGVDGPVGFYAMSTDITARKNSELVQAESEERLRTITDNLPVLITYIDQHEIYRFANATYERWFGITPAAMIGRTVREVLGQQSYERESGHLHQNLAGQPTRHETTFTSTDGARTAQVVGIPHVKDGTVLGVYLMTTDVSAAKQHELQLQALARSDALTGLPNRRSYEEKLNESALRSVRSGRALGLIFIDIDFFKQINDSLGHAGGDEVLKQFSTRLKVSVRATDAVCRLAGDEFTIILEGVASVDEIGPVADKILAAIRAPFLVAGSVCAVTTSIGVACHSAKELDLAVLSKQADTALYRAKAAGRNRFCVF